MDLAAPAGDAGVLLEGRLEHSRPEMHAGQPLVVERGGHPFGLDPRRANQLERAGGAASLGGHRPLEEHGARVDDGGVERGHVG